MRQCVKCGEKVERLVRGILCLKCFLEVYGLGSFPERITVVQCPRCGGFRYQGRWLPGLGSLEELIRLILQSSFKPNEEVEYYRVERLKVVSDKYHGDYAVVDVVGKVKGFEQEVHKEYVVRVSLAKQLCPTCFKRAAGSVQAVVQVRGWSGRLAPDEKRMVLELLNSLPSAIMEAVVDVEEVREGIDVKMLDQGAARVLAAKLKNAFAAKVSESHKVVGRRSDGKRVSKLTLSVRLPFFKEGSLVDYRGRLAVVEKVARGFVLVRPLGSKKLVRLSIESSWRELSIPHTATQRKAVLAAYTPNAVHLQFLDGSYEYQEYLRNRVILEGEPVGGGEVVVLEYNGATYIIAESPNLKHDTLLP